jgi:PhnB protein
MATKSIPEGYRSITPSFCVEGAQEFIDFIKHVFNAQDRFKMDGPGGKIMHAELSIGDSADGCRCAATMARQEQFPVCLCR